MEFRAIYDQHVAFVWRSLLRLGLPNGDVPDAVQDVFVVVHRKLGEFEGRSKPTTWLFGICMRVASDRRRRAHVRRERLTTSPPAVIDAAEDADALLDQRRARLALEAILGRMPEEQRVVFVLFELEGMTGEDIAELLGVPVGTVRSRLRLARDEFERAVARLQAREGASAAATEVCHG
jgi:RNA polymerase sigma-70 factor (ECF subfamily)